VGLLAKKAWKVKNQNRVLSGRLRRRCNNYACKDVWAVELCLGPHLRELWREMTRKIELRCDAAFSFGFLGSLSEESYINSTWNIKL
jgi:hypothetical protein